MIDYYRYKKIDVTVILNEVLSVRNRKISIKKNIEVGNDKSGYDIMKMKKSENGRGKCEKKEKITALETTKYQYKNNNNRVSDRIKKK